jgi:hypothetical protein
MPRADVFVTEVANELATWPGVRVERRADGAAIVMYEHVQLGVLDREAGQAELGESHAEHDELIEHGDAEQDASKPYADAVTHAIHGASDVTAVLALFDSRYRDVRGEDDPYSSEDPA